MLRIGEIFAAAAHHRGLQPLQDYIDAFTKDAALLDEFSINTSLRTAHFLAQLLHETGGGTIRFESLVYRTGSRLLEIFGVGRHSAAIRPSEVPGLLGDEPKLAERVYGLGNPSKARELGNTEPGDGYRYRGGGLMQTTGRSAYRSCGQRAGVDFETDPELIVSATHALKPAVFEWADGRLNDAADRNDIVRITRTINGGLNGLDERRAWLAVTWLLAGGDAATPVWQAAAPDDTTAWVQGALNRLGTTPKLEVDGRCGPLTAACVRAFQAREGLEVDGIAGFCTRGAMRAMLGALETV
jgi:putative chitinase